MNILLFVIIIPSSFLLVYFYRFQRRFIKSSYYAFYELITGLPSYLSFTELLLIKFLPPFLVSFLAYFLFNRFILVSFLWYSLIGFISAMMMVIPSVTKVRLYRGKDPKLGELKRKITSLYVVYFFQTLSFTIISGMGSYFAFVLKNFSWNSLLPSAQGVIDGLWIALIVILFNKLNKPIV